jgi:hypothetical protein
VVVVADDARNLPGTVFAPPQMDELAFAEGLGIFMSRVVKAVHTLGCLSLLWLIQIHVRGTLRDFIVEILDFQRHTVVVRILQVALEQQLPLCL